MKEIKEKKCPSGQHIRLDGREPKCNCMKKETWKTHAIAQCQDCDWRNEDYHNAQGTGAIHAKKHKHLVNVEVGLASYYDGREEKSAKK